MNKGSAPIKKREIVSKIFGIALVLVVIGVITTLCIRAEVPEKPFQGGQGLVEKLTLDELTARADCILVGEVSDIACYRKGEGNIYTLVTLSVEQAIKGQPQEEIAVGIPGGELNSQTLWVEDVPSFQSGERVVVFLEESEGVFSVAGGFQGKFSIGRNNMVSGNILLSEFIDQIRQIATKY